MGGRAIEARALIGGQALAEVRRAPGARRQPQFAALALLGGEPRRVGIGADLPPS